MVRPMAPRFVGGLAFSRTRYVSTPLVELRATTDALSFNLRFGLGRMWGPWIVSRAELASIRTAPSPILQWIRIDLHMLDGRHWTFWATTPEAVLHCLQQLGYPVTLPPGYPPAKVNP
jgi:hypothetical protein